MSGPTKIEWADAVWNPVTGCTKVSEGCRNCYAERQAKRFAGRAGYPAKEPFTVTLHPERLEEPLHWRKPRRILVCSMGDLFHPDVPDAFIYQVFCTVARCERHTFQVLTKRPERMTNFCQRIRYIPTRALSHLKEPGISYWPNDPARHDARPLPNVWLGTSIEDQETADERIPHLLRCPAAVRFLSYEPALGPVDFGLHGWVRLPEAVRGDFPFQSTVAQPGIYRAQTNRYGALSVSAANGHSLGIKPGEFERLPNLDWVIAGGESGPRARPCHVEWIRDVIGQCRAADVPIFVKQLGRYPSSDSPEGSAMPWEPLWGDQQCTVLSGRYAPAGGRLGDSKGGDPLEWPEDLRVRKWPDPYLQTGMGS